MTAVPSLRSRQPLAPLPLSHYVLPSNSLPSPISFPLKRNAPSTLGSSSSSTLDSPKMRKVSYTDAEGIETIKRTRVKQVTPKAKALLEKDEMGIGRSPARRLFVDASQQSLGIVGAVPPSPTSLPSRSLAPSPPISTRAMPTSPILNTQPIENDQDIHDVGFAIHTDGITINAPPTPDSRPTVTSNPSLAPDAASHLPSSPASTSRSYGSQFDEDQENIPPVLSYSTSSTPSKHSSTTLSPTSRRSHTLEDDWIPGSASRHRRTIERSKLGLKSVISSQEEVEEELTPGRRTLRRVDVKSARGLLTREVNRI